MTRQKRRVLFYIFLCLFLAITPAIMLYSLGQVPDFGAFKLVETGGIFVKSKTTNLSVFLNNEFQKDTSFFSGGALLTGIKPGNYIIKIEKEGHKSWYKSVDVLPEQVTELRHILILPKIVQKEKLEKSGWKIISLSPDRNLMLLEKKFKNTVIFSFFGMQNKNYYPIAQISSLPVSKAVWGDGAVIFKKNNLFSKIRIGGDTPYKEEVIALPSKNYMLVSAELYGTADSLVLLDSAGSLYVSKNGLAKKIKDNVNSFAVYGENAFFIDKNGFLAKINLGSNEVKVINRPGFFLSDKKAEFIFSPKGDLLIIDASGGLFFVSSAEENNIRPLAGQVLGAEFDGLGKKLLFWTPNEIKIFWTEPNGDQPFQKEFTIEPIFRIDDGISEASWFTADDFHIFIRAKSGIYITEIDGRGGRNTIELIGKKTDKVFWDGVDKLYFSSPDGIEIISL